MICTWCVFPFMFTVIRIKKKLIVNKEECFEHNIDNGSKPVFNFSHLHLLFSGIKLPTRFVV